MLNLEHIINILKRPAAIFFIIASLSFGSLPSIANASEKYTPELLTQALQSGDPVVLEFYASWCGTCRSQSKALANIQADPDMSKLIILQADFDNDTALKKQFNVKKQSTLILLKQGEEVDRAVGITKESALKKFIAQAS